MAGLMIINGSPRAPRSNSKRLIALFAGFWGPDFLKYSAAEQKAQALFPEMENCSDVLLVFPLYVDGIPAPLLRLLEAMERYAFRKKPTVHVVLNCGFLEAEQNQIASDQIRLFCRQNAFPFGSVLWIGAGEAILDTPFSFLVKQKLKRLACAVRLREPVCLKVTMPIPKRFFLKASSSYWLARGRKNGLDREQMASAQIESDR